MRLELRAGPVEVDLLVAEAQREPAFAERLGPHPEALVEGDGRVDVADGQDEVIEGCDAHAGTVGPAMMIDSSTVARMTGNLLDGWRASEYGRSRQGVALRVFMPAGDGPVAGLLTAAQHGEEAVTALLARRLLEQVPGVRDGAGPSCRSSIPTGCSPARGRTTRASTSTATSPPRRGCRASRSPIRRASRPPCACPSTARTAPRPARTPDRSPRRRR